jgi:hypothetical protein
MEGLESGYGQRLGDAAPEEPSAFGGGDEDVFAEGEFVPDTLGRPRPLLTPTQADHAGAWVQATMNTP